MPCGPLEAVIQEEGTRGSIVHQAVFVPNVNLIDECRQIIRDFYGKEMPATSYIPQPPCEGKLLAIEALGIGRGLGEVEIDRVSEQLVIARHNHIAWCHCAEVVPQNGNGSVYDASLDAFQQIRGLLESVNIPFDQVIRTWLYLGGIVAGRRTHAALQGTQPRTDRLLPGHPFSGRPLAARPPATIYPVVVGGSFRPARASAPRAAE